MTDLISADRCERPAPKKTGRPIIGKERMTVWPRIGMTESQYQVYMKNGGAKWLRGLIEP